MRVTLWPAAAYWAAASRSFRNVEVNATLLQLSGKPLSRDLLRGYTGGLDYDSGSFGQSLRGGECGGRFLGVASRAAGGSPPAHRKQTA